MRRPAPAIGDDETLDQILARQPTETGGRRIKDGVAVRTRYLAAFGTMTLAGGADLSVDLETDFAAQEGTSKRVCHKAPFEIGRASCRESVCRYVYISVESG